jgi:hypothetical protein
LVLIIIANRMYVERPTCTASGVTMGQIPLSMHRFGKICPSFKQQRQQMKIPGRWTLIHFLWLSIFWRATRPNKSNLASSESAKSPHFFQYFKLQQAILYTPTFIATYCILQQRLVLLGYHRVLLAGFVSFLAVDYFFLRFISSRHLLYFYSYCSYDRRRNETPHFVSHLFISANGAIVPWKSSFFSWTFLLWSESCYRHTQMQQKCLLKSLTPSRPPLRPTPCTSGALQLYSLVCS